MKKLLSLLLVAAMLICFSALAFADANPPYQIENGDFETGDLTGWTPSSGTNEAPAENDETENSEPARTESNENADTEKEETASAETENP